MSVLDSLNSLPMPSLFNSRPVAKSVGGSDDYLKRLLLAGNIAWLASFVMCWWVLSHVCPSLPVHY